MAKPRKDKASEPTDVGMPKLSDVLQEPAISVLIGAMFSENGFWYPEEFSKEQWEAAYNWYEAYIAWQDKQKSNSVQLALAKLSKEEIALLREHFEDPDSKDFEYG